jgi:general secretion pathway protein E
MTALAKLLVESGAVPASRIEDACRLADDTGEPLVAVLTRLGLVTEAEVCRLVASRSAIPVLDPSAAWRPLAGGGLSIAFLERHLAVPLDGPEGPVLAMADPGHAMVRSAVAQALGRQLPLRVTTAGRIRRLLRGDETGAAPAASSAAPNDDDRARLADAQRDEPAIRLLDDLVEEALTIGASDLHLEPARDGIRVSVRRDGALGPLRTLPLDLGTAIVARIKLLARLDVAERRMPQDGRFRIPVAGRPVDLRVSVLPTLAGEAAVLRLLDKATERRDIAALGFPDTIAERLAVLTGLPHGLVLVVGPTGSGKTTTLYALLDRLAGGSRKLVGVEDPVEFDLPGVVQVQVNPAIGLDFARVLRSVLRHDPDVVMVGEIRDGETARIAVQAALTGHLVLATLHTGTAAEAVPRLLDMGIEPYLLAAVLRGVLSQRLVRSLCDCAREEGVPAALVPALGIAAWRVATGCAACRGTGHAGRRPIAELMTIDAAMRGLVADRAPAAALEASAPGFRSLRRAGLALVAAGRIAYADLAAVLGDDAGPATGG